MLKIAILNISFKSPRNCMGNRYAMIAAKVFVVELLKAYKFSTTVKIDKMKMKLAFVGRLNRNYSVSITKRSPVFN